MARKPGSKNVPKTVGVRFADIARCVTNDTIIPVGTDFAANVLNVDVASLLNQNAEKLQPMVVTAAPKPEPALEFTVED
jgi:hypothetical protein